MLPVTEQNKNADVDFNKFLYFKVRLYMKLCVASSFAYFHVCTCASSLTVVEVSALRCNAMSLDNWFLTFGDDIVVLSSRVNVLLYCLWTLRPLKMGSLLQEAATN